MSFRLPKAAQRDLNKPLPADAEEQAINVRIPVHDTQSSTVLTILAQGARRDAIFAGMSAALVSGNVFLCVNYIYGSHISNPVQRS